MVRDLSLTERIEATEFTDDAVGLFRVLTDTHYVDEWASVVLMAVAALLARECPKPGSPKLLKLADEFRDLMIEVQARVQTEANRPGLKVVAGTDLAPRGTGSTDG